ATRDVRAEGRRAGAGLPPRAAPGRLDHDPPSGSALADRAGHRLLGVQRGAYRLHDLAEVLVVERHGAPQRTEATSKSRPASTAEEKSWPSSNVRPASKRSPCRVTGPSAASLDPCGYPAGGVITTRPSSSS